MLDVCISSREHFARHCFNAPFHVYLHILHPSSGAVSRFLAWLRVDRGGERVTVSDETFERLKFEPREECSEGAEEPPETPDEPNPASDEPGM